MVMTLEVELKDSKTMTLKLCEDLFPPQKTEYYSLYLEIFLKFAWDKNNENDVWILWHSFETSVYFLPVIYTIIGSFFKKP